VFLNYIPLSKHWKTHLGIRSAIRAKSVKALQHEPSFAYSCLGIARTKGRDDRADDIDLFANMKQAGASCWQPSKKRAASRSTSPRM
jgi:hypothetical protein